jgi:hypothetical protein
VYGPQGANIAGVQRISLTVTVPLDATGCNFGVGCAGSSSDPGFQQYVDGVLLEQSATAGDYFDGATPDGDLVRYGWTGTANASASIQESRTLITPETPNPPQWVPGAPRVFDLGLRSRTVDHQSKTVTVDLASDEALLMDYATLTEDGGARAHQASLRAVCNYVLGKIGASLAPGGPDADVTAYWSLANLFPDPSAESPVLAWAPDVNAPAPTRSG